MSSSISIPSTGFLIELMQDRKLHPEGFLDILEKRLEEDADLVSSEDLYDLYRSGRLSKEEYVAHERSWPDDETDVDPVDELDSLTETYGREPLD